MIRLLVVAAVAAALLMPAAFAGTITTFAGGGTGVNPNPPPLPATQAVLASPRSVVVDSAGDFHLTSTTDGGAGASSLKRIAKVSGGILTTRVAAAGGVSAMAIDSAGNIFYTDAASHQVKRLDAANNVTVIAGTGTAGYGGDNGPAAGAQLNAPNGIAIYGADLLVSDSGNHRIRRISGGNIATVAGTGASGYDGDEGPAASARIHLPAGIVADGAGGYYFVDVTPSGQNLRGRLRHVDAAGVIRTRAALPLNDPGALARDAFGSVYVAGGIFNSAITRVDSAGNAVIVAGSGAPGQGGDGGPAVGQTLFQPYGVALSASGEMFIADTSNGRIRKVVGGIISTVAGGGSPPPPYIGDGGPATSAVFAFPSGVSVDAAGNVLVSDSSGSRVRRIDTGGTITTLAGNGTSGSGGDGGPATSAGLYGPSDAIVGGSTTYIADDLNRRIRRVDNTGTIATIAGVGPSGPVASSSAGDGGPATVARLSGARSLALDSSGRLYVHDPGRLRRIDTSGVIETVAGNGTLTYPGDGELATRVGFGGARPVFDAAGNLYIADGPLHAVRKVDAAGIVTTVAGDGIDGYSGDGGPATAARLTQPNGMAFDPSGNLYIGDSLQHRIRKVSPDGIISTIAGTGTAGFSGDGGEAALARLSSPSALAWHAPSSSLLVADSSNRRIRAIAIADDTPAAFTFTAQSGSAPSATVQSNTVTPTAFAVAAPISIAGGEYSIGCAGTFTSAAGIFAPGQSVCVRHTASALGNATTTTALTIGGVKGVFASTTLPGGGSFTASPAPIDFGTRWVYTSSPAQAITIANTGGSPITVHAITTALPYRLTHDCTALLAPGASCVAQVTFKPLAAGAANGGVTIQASAGTQTVALSGTGSLSLTSHYYQSVLGRAPDSGGQAFWDGEAARIIAAGGNVNEVWFAMAMQFYYSAEYLARGRDNAGYVTDLYLTFFNRAPDAGGQAYWVGLLDQGVPREAVLAQFMFSPEFAAFANNIFGPRAVRAEIDMVMDFYRGLLLRLPDGTGLGYWVQRFRAAQCGQNASTLVRAEAYAMAAEFVASAEYTARNRTDAQFVGDLYNAIMRRGGDAGGIQYWIAELSSGRRTRANVLNAFVNQNQEFPTRVGRVAGEPCIPG